MMLKLQSSGRQVAHPALSLTMSTLQKGWSQLLPGHGLLEGRGKGESLPREGCRIRATTGLTMPKTWPQHRSSLPSTSCLQEMQERCTALHCPMSQGWTSLHPGHKTGRISACREGEHWHWNAAALGDLLVQLALLHQCGGPGAEGLQGLSGPMVALGCRGDSPCPLPGALLHNRHPKPTGPYTAPGEPLVFLHNSWQLRHVGNSSGPGDSQACQLGGKLWARWDTGSSLHQHAESQRSLEGKQLRGHQTASEPQSCLQSDPNILPKLCVTLAQAPATSFASSHSLHPAPCKLLHPVPPCLPGHVRLEEPCLLPHPWDTLLGLLSPCCPETTVSAPLLISAAFRRASHHPAAGPTRTRASHVPLDILAQLYSRSSC